MTLQKNLRAPEKGSSPRAGQPLGRSQIAVFMTGNRHASENLTAPLKRRASGLAPPTQMCGALGRNASKDYETILANCLVHARRRFVVLIDRLPEDCAYVIEQLGKVYHHESLAKEQALPPQQRLTYHQQHSAPVMAEINNWYEEQVPQNRVEPNSGLGKAMRYLLKHWDKLTRFLHVAKAPLDNNLCQRALKHAILHRCCCLDVSRPAAARPCVCCSVGRRSDAAGWQLLFFNCAPQPKTHEFFDDPAA